jgi:hypothetical protein
MNQPQPGCVFNVPLEWDCSGKFVTSNKLFDPRSTSSSFWVLRSPTPAAFPSTMFCTHARKAIYEDHFQAIVASGREFR